MIMLGGGLPETENKRICQISGLKSGRGRFRNLSGGRLRESSGNKYLTETQRLFTKWSLTGGGRLREVVAMRELTVYIFVLFWTSIRDLLISFYIRIFSLLRLLCIFIPYIIYLRGLLFSKVLYSVEFGIAFIKKIKKKIKKIC